MQYPAVSPPYARFRRFFKMDEDPNFIVQSALRFAAQSEVIQF
jgi:hypothetical protein